MTDSVSTSVVQDNLYTGEFPEIKGSRNIDASQTIVRGSVLGKVKYGAITVTPDGGNTGDGTVTAAAVLAGTGAPIVGDYVLTCISAVTKGGVFKLEDPNGNLVAGSLAIEVGSPTAFSVGGITFTITDGAADFVAGDLFTLALAAGSGKYKLLDVAAVDGSGVFDSIALAPATTGVGEDQLIPVAESGCFRQESLGFGGATTVADVIDQMRILNCYVRSATVYLGV